jgi:hypothetical protein
VLDPGIGELRATLNQAFQVAHEQQSTPFADHLGGHPEPGRHALFVAPSAQASTILDRTASTWALLGRRAHRDSVSVSSSVRTSFAIGRPVLGIDEDYQRYVAD